MMTSDRDCLVAIARCRRIADGNEDILRVCDLLQARIAGDVPDQLADLQRKAAQRQKNYRKRQKAKSDVTENPENDDCGANIHSDVTV